MGKSAGREDAAGYMGDQGRRKEGDKHEGRWIGTGGEGEKGKAEIGGKEF